MFEAPAASARLTVAVLFSLVLAGAPAATASAPAGLEAESGAAARAGLRALGDALGVPRGPLPAARPGRQPWGAPDAGHCSWAGVACCRDAAALLPAPCGAADAVAALDLTGAGLDGSLPPALDPVLAASLQLLLLADNPRLSGAWPPGLALPQLALLDVRVRGGASGEGEGARGGTRAVAACRRAVWGRCGAFAGCNAGSLPFPPAPKPASTRGRPPQNTSLVACSGSRQDAAGRASSQGASGHPGRFRASEAARAVAGAACSVPLLLALAPPSAADRPLADAPDLVCPAPVLASGGVVRAGAGFTNYHGCRCRRAEDELVLQERAGSDGGGDVAAWRLDCLDEAPAMLRRWRAATALVGLLPMALTLLSLAACYW
jgi:hypothetical protein